MPAITVYFLNTAATAPNWFGRVQDNGTAPGGALSAFGWTVAKTAVTTPYWRGRFGATARAAVASTGSWIDAQTGPVKGTGSAATTAGDSFISDTALTGTFAAGNWNFTFGMRTGAVTTVGRIRLHVWASVNADGTSARKLNSAAGTLVGTTVTMNSATATFNSTVTWNAPQIVLNNEYLFTQIEWQETTAGTSNSCTAQFYQCLFTTTNWDGIASGAGTAAGTGTATAAGGSTVAAGGAANGAGGATAVGTGIKPANSSAAAGIGAATAVGELISHGVGTAAGTGTATAVGEEVSTGPVAFLRPDGDTALDGWTDQADGTSNIYQSIDEATAGDTDFVQSPAVDAATSDLKVRLIETTAGVGSEITVPISGFAGSFAQSFGDTSDTLYVQSFTAIGNAVSKIAAWVSVAGTNADGVTIKLYTADANERPATLLGASNAVPASAMSGTAALLDFNFSTPVAVTSGVKYVFEMGRTGAGHATNNYRVYVCDAPAYGGGKWQYYSAGAWDEFAGYDIVSVVTQPAVIGIGTPGGSIGAQLGTTAGPKNAQNFISIDTAISAVRVQLWKNASPSVGNVQIKIFTVDGSHQPLAQVGVTSSGIASTSIATTETSYDFTFSPPVAVANGTEYIFVAEVTGALSTLPNSLNIGIKSFTGYAGGNWHFFNGTAWDSSFITYDVVSQIISSPGEGLTQIAEWTHTDIAETFTTAEQTLTAPQTAAITDFANLFAELDDNQGNVYRFALSNPSAEINEPIKLRYRYKKLVEETAPWTPADLPNLVGWYKADTGVTAPGGNVTVVTDQSGLGHHLSNIGAVPLSATAYNNGFPAFNFIAANDAALICSGFGMGAAARASVMVAGQMNGSTAQWGGCVVYGLAGTGNDWNATGAAVFISRYDLDAAIVNTHTGTNTGSKAVSLGTPHRFMSIFSALHGGVANAGLVYVDNSVNSPGANSGTAFISGGTLMIGNRWLSGAKASNPWDGPMSEIIVCNGEVSLTDRALVDAYFLERFTAVPGEEEEDMILYPTGYEPPNTNYATLDTRNNHPVLDFDTTTAESAIWTFVLPVSYAGGGLTVAVAFSMETATTGTCGFTVEIERIGDGGQDVDSDGFASAQTIAAVTVPATSGLVDVVSVNISSGANMDSLAAGEMGRLRLTRDVANDTASGDAEVHWVRVTET